MIKPVLYSDILEAPNAAALLREYADECSLPEIGEPAPQAQMYKAMEATGLMQSFGAYAEDQLIGFATVLTYVLPHYGKSIASIESIFVAKEHRSSSTGRALMTVAEDYARSKQCKVMLYSAPTGSSLERLLNLMGRYRRTNSVFLRILA